MITTATENWITVCSLQDIAPDTGVCVRFKGRQIAVFRLHDSHDVRAIHNCDPFTDANVLARGIIGDRDGELKVTSPLLKHAFSLETGTCFDDPNVRIPVYPARVRDNQVQLPAP